MKYMALAATALEALFFLTAHFSKKLLMES
jgi:hypothetical protein